MATTGQVLLQSTGCGSVSYDVNNMTTAQIIHLETAMLVGSAELGSVSQAYAQVCYVNPQQPAIGPAYEQYSSSSNCEYFVEQNLTYTTSYEGECPFRDFCSVPSSEVLTLDTGYLDSLTHLGQNEPPENRVEFRRKQTCAPVRANNSVIDTRVDFTDFQALGNLSIWSYGYFNTQPSLFLQFGQTPFINTTFIYAEAADFAATVPYYLISASTLDLDFLTYKTNFYPSPDLINDTSAPLSLFFLANRASFWDPVFDPWFNATSQQELATGGTADEEVHVYYNSEPGAVLACLEQGQICNPNAPGGRRCTDLDSWYTWSGIPSVFSDIGLNAVQTQIASDIHNSFWASTADHVVTQLGGASLVASDYITSQTQFTSPALAPEHWKIEVSNWFGTGLSGLQHSYISNVRPPTAKMLSPYWSPFPDGSISHSICAGQKIRDTAYQTFSVLGLAVSFTLGGIIIIAGQVFTGLVPELRKGRGKDDNHDRQWIARGTLQLQRLAFERLGLGEWEGDDTSVPVTKTGQLFAIPLLTSESVDSDNMPLTHVTKGRSKSTRAISDASDRSLTTDAVSDGLLVDESRSQRHGYDDDIDDEEHDTVHHGAPSLSVDFHDDEDLGLGVVHTREY